MPGETGEFIDDTVLHKVDGELRSLLRMKDEDIIAALEQYHEEKASAPEPLEELLMDETLPREERLVLERALIRGARQRHPVFDALVLEKAKPVNVRALVEFTGNRGDIESFGVEVRSGAHDIFTVTGTVDRLAVLAAQPATQRMSLPRIMRPTVADALVQNDIKPVHEPPGVNKKGYKGKDIIIGVVDTALEVTHNAFRKPETVPNSTFHGTRVLYYWVQEPDADNAAGLTPAKYTEKEKKAGRRVPDFSGFDYGRLYRSQDIDVALKRFDVTKAYDKVYGSGTGQISALPNLQKPGHGTHVAGLAAGGGHGPDWETPNWNAGAAPEATLIHVRYNADWRDTGFDDHVQDAASFIFKAADFHKMSAVVNLSMGSHLGPHNGTTKLDMAFDNMLNSFDNRSIVVATGNYNKFPWYYRKKLRAAGFDSFSIKLHKPSSGKTFGYLEIWCNGVLPDLKMQNGPTIIGWIKGGKAYEKKHPGITVKISPNAQKAPGLRNIRIFLGEFSADSTWNVQLRNPSSAGAVDCFLWTQNAITFLSGKMWAGEMTLMDTCCAQSVLSVGAGMKPKFGEVASPQKNEPVWPQSGAGPTLDKRIKPEIIAIGSMEKDLVFPDSQKIGLRSAKSGPGSDYALDEGTSMAAPIASGAVALLFDEANALKKTLNQELVKELLIRFANRKNLNLDPLKPGFKASDRNLYGWGRLRLRPAIDHMLPNGSVDVWIRTAKDDYGHMPYIGRCFWGAPDIEIFDGSGKPATRLKWGQPYDVRLTLRNRGNFNAVGTLARLKYTLPSTAPNNWTQAKEPGGKPLEQKVMIPALGIFKLRFRWVPQRGEVPGAKAGTTHYCVLAELDHPKDRLNHPAPTTPGGSAWATNIKSNNNVALRNVHIQ